MGPTKRLNPNLNETGQRVLAVLLLLLPLVLLYGLVIAPYLKILVDNRERIEDLRFQLQRLQRTAAKAPLWEQQLQALQQDPATRRHYLQGATPALASAELQKRLGEIVRAAGGELTSTQVLGTKEEDGFTRISVRARFTVSSRQLQEILQEIEANPPYLLVDRLTVRPIRVRRDPKTRKFIPVDKLNVDLTVYGYMKTQPS
ncbi:general secretion pathway protein M [Methylomarinovum caldicuralii]|uniref:General secretion pathway protein M n=1 Tax=Methylomarinovum caldicuralii TaxID=438856 RepID=A0AAU9C5A6_9GAMM|nr:type II secretion system protein GspM [Methylomarinovum caldicuralii]BCX82425.1 general secretion pathway protein M [Methylomarinovum caldicuralii]